MTKNKNILDHIGSTEDAATLWDMSESNVKKLATNGKIKAKKLRREWAVDLTQPNPKKNNTTTVK